MTPITQGGLIKIKSLPEDSSDMVRCRHYDYIGDKPVAYIEFLIAKELVIE